MRERHKQVLQQLVSAQIVDIESVNRLGKGTERDFELNDLLEGLMKLGLGYHGKELSQENLLRYAVEPLKSLSPKRKRLIIFLLMSPDLEATQENLQADVYGDPKSSAKFNKLFRDTKDQLKQLTYTLPNGRSTVGLLKIVMMDGRQKKFRQLIVTHPLYFGLSAKSVGLNSGAAKNGELRSRWQGTVRKLLKPSTKTNPQGKSNAHIGDGDITTTEESEPIFQADLPGGQSVSIEIYRESLRLIEEAHSERRQSQAEARRYERRIHELEMEINALLSKRVPRQDANPKLDQSHCFRRPAAIQSRSSLNPSSDL